MIEVVPQDESPMNSDLCLLEKSPGTRMPVESCGHHLAILGSTAFASIDGTVQAGAWEHCVSIHYVFDTNMLT